MFQQHIDGFSTRGIRQGEIHQGDHVLFALTVAGAFKGIERINLQPGLLRNGLGQHAAHRQAVFHNQYFPFHPAP